MCTYSQPKKIEKNVVQPAWDQWRPLCPQVVRV